MAFLVGFDKIISIFKAWKESTHTYRVSRDLFGELADQPLFLSDSEM